ncbi:MAG: gephyrin-like molybdotransferase Glp [Leifsonia sp.]
MAAPTARVPVAEYAARIDSLLAPVRNRDAESVALLDALGRVTASAVASPVDLPPFRNSQMDGFAVRSGDVAGVPVELPILGEIAAAPGEPEALAAGSTVRIMTGAPIPPGADAVVPVEDTTVSGTTVRVLRSRAAGDYVREAGSDLRVGDELLPAGIRIESRHLAALAAAGLTTVSVASRVRVAVVSTGSELVEPGGELGPGQIPDSNGIALRAAAAGCGAVVVHAARVRDDPDDLRSQFDRAVVAGAEVILTSGGVSMGEHEVVRDLLGPRGAWIGSVAMQPGGPQANAEYAGLPVVCFPGNPVSSQLSFALFVAPLLRELAGLAPAAEGRRAITTAVRSLPGRRQYLRGRRLPTGEVAVIGGPGSHLVAALAASDVLIVVPEDVVDVAAGDLVEVLSL